MARHVMETSVSGFKVRGSWKEVVEHGGQVTQALRTVAETTEDPAMEADLEAWEIWRPKEEESLDDEISKKTADHASIEQGEGEEAGITPAEDLAEARRKLAEAGGHLAQGTFNEVMDSIGESVGRATRAADSAGRRAFRSVEDAVYRRLMTSVSPYYFDSEFISAVLRKASSEEATFVLEVNINDDGLKQAVAGELGVSWGDEEQASRDPAQA